MATRRISPAGSTSSPDNEKGLAVDGGYAYDTPSAHDHVNHRDRVRGLETEEGYSLHRGLKARHIAMIAIGGAIGTGLIIGTGSALAGGGPGSIFIAYLFVGSIVFVVMSALGEMAAWLPLSSGFTGYATRYVDPSLGFAFGWTYWMKYVITTPNQLTACSLVMQYWVPRTKANPGVWIAIFLVMIILINLVGIRFFGELEFWMSAFKVLTICGVIILSLVLALGGGPDHDRKGFRYWKNPGAFKNKYPNLGDEDAGRFLAFWSTLGLATYAYLGTELVGVTVAEAQNPRRTIPKAIRLTFYRILFFYVLSVFLVGMLVPYNSKDLAFATSATTGANASPFVVAIKLSGIKALDHILNACILVFVFSASNSDLYIASRTLYGLSTDRSAPRIFSRTNSRGTPIYAIAVAALIALIAFLNVSNDSKVVFGYFTNLVTILGMMAWISILVSHIFFVRARRVQNLRDSEMPYVAPAGLWGSYIALFFCILIALTKNYDVFVHNHKTYGNFDYKNFITGYLGIPIYLALIFGHKIVTKSKTVQPHECDLYSGKDIIDRQEDEFLARKTIEDEMHARQRDKTWFYNRYISWLF